MFTAKLFLGYDYMFGLTVGYIMAAVCPAVVVPAILNLNSQNLAKKNGVSTLIFGAASIDDILAITLVTINTSLMFVSDSKSHGTIFDPVIPAEHSSWMFIVIEIILSMIPGISFGLLNGWLTVHSNNVVKGIASLGGSWGFFFLCYFWIGMPSAS